MSFTFILINMTKVEKHWLVELGLYHLVSDPILQVQTVQLRECFAPNYHHQKVFLPLGCWEWQRDLFFSFSDKARGVFKLINVQTTAGLSPPPLPPPDTHTHTHTHSSSVSSCTHTQRQAHGLAGSKMSIIHVCLIFGCVEKSVDWQLSTVEFTFERIKTQSYSTLSHMLMCYLWAETFFKHKIYCRYPSYKINALLSVQIRSKKSQITRGPSRGV